MVELSKQQSEALGIIDSWFSSGLKQHLCISGYAGTGKTFIIPHIFKHLCLEGDEYAVCAYTGKASYNLQLRGVDAKTIHSLIYNAREIINLETKQKEVVFEKVLSLPERLKLIVIDEASMVGIDMHEDLLSYGKKILYLGDCFQLPPVNSDVFNLMDEKNLSYNLTEIHRCASDNPILKISKDIRMGYDIDNCRGELFSKINASELKNSELLSYDQMICGYNETRKGLNEFSRTMLKKSGSPKKFEKLIVLRNNARFGVFNGQIIYTVDKVKRNGSKSFAVKYVDAYKIKRLYNGEYGYDDNDVCSHLFSRRNFEDIQNAETRDEMYKYVLADYGYCITVHKAQGSEWNSVLFYDDGFGSGVMRQRWLYTAVTRSKKQCLWINTING